MTTVLIVDDEPDIRDLLRIVLERADFTVLDVGNGAEALELCKEKAPDILLTDLLMPRMSGADLLTALAEKGVACKVIVMSGGSLGSDPTAEMSKVTTMGVDDVIAKPFNPADVVSACQKVASEL
jgi:two-component system, OmpR family, phosphate regulon response regulator PhoB